MFLNTRNLRNENLILFFQNPNIRIRSEITELKLKISEPDPKYRNTQTDSTHLYHNTRKSKISEPNPNGYERPHLPVTKQPLILPFLEQAIRSPTTSVSPFSLMLFDVMRITQGTWTWQLLLFAFLVLVNLAHVSSCSWIIWLSKALAFLHIIRIWSLLA